MLFSQEDAKSCNDEIHDSLADFFVLMSSSTHRESNADWKVGLSELQLSL